VSTAATAETQPLEGPTNQTRFVDLALRARTFGIVVVLGLVVLVTTSIQSRFLSSNDVQFILSGAAIYAVMAVGEAMVIVTRNVDLSVGSVAGLCAFVCAGLFHELPGIPTVAVFAIGALLGGGCGLITGLLSAICRIPSLVVTLAMLWIVRSVDVLLVGGGQVTAGQVPRSFLLIFYDTIPGIGVPDIAVGAAVLMVAVYFYMSSFRSGRDLYAIGSDPDAARLAGIPIAKRITTAFVMSGALAGIAGVLYASQIGTIDSTAATGYELQVIASVVIGGVAIFGGSGNVIGAALGALLLGTITSALYTLGVNQNWDEAFQGLLIILAITLDRGIQAQLANALRRRRVRLGA
jgi:rhamnose transport system permease protein